MSDEPATDAELTVAAILMTDDNDGLPVAADKIGRWLLESHCGDCTNEIHTCTRCWAERFTTLARRVIDAIKEPA